METLFFGVVCVNDSGCGVELQNLVVMRVDSVVAVIKRCHYSFFWTAVV